MQNLIITKNDTRITYRLGEKSKTVGIHDKFNSSMFGKLLCMGMDYQMIPAFLHRGVMLDITVIDNRVVSTRHIYE